MYTTPRNNFGRLTYEMWRAARLVVEHGDARPEPGASGNKDWISGWRTPPCRCTRSTTEIDRYISWPGRRWPTIRPGEIKIRELRQRAEETLGETSTSASSTKSFSSSAPSSPQTVLEDEIEALIENQGVAG